MNDLGLGEKGAMDSQMQDVWNIQIILAKKLIEVCNKYKLKIWADSGTLIGTIREHGYIPWDDDIDMIMFREDYEKLLSIAPSEFKNPFFFQNWYSDVKYPRGHSQLRYCGTSAVLKEEVKLPFNQGIFIDIFVYDTVPQNSADIKAFVEKIEKKRMFIRKLAYSELSSKHLKFSFYWFLYKILPYKYICRSFENLIQKYNNTSSERIYFLGLTTKKLETRYLKKEWYSETLWLPFEDMLMPVPSGYDSLLREEYGDYMTPVEQSTMHGDVYLDAYRDYKTVIAEILQKR
ncbi:MAG: LicD family protein [Paludibacteraceae bacterium]|nr:LicD family protein [Paludibacteraceae bacterium]